MPLVIKDNQQQESVAALGSSVVRQLDLASQDSRLESWLEENTEKLYIKL